jgi:hypothetical protein
MIWLNKPVLWHSSRVNGYNFKIMTPYEATLARNYWLSVRVATRRAGALMTDAREVVHVRLGVRSDNNRLFLYSHRYLRYGKPSLLMEDSVLVSLPPAPLAASFFELTSRLVSLALPFPVPLPLPRRSLTVVSLWSATATRASFALERACSANGTPRRCPLFLASSASSSSSWVRSSPISAPNLALTPLFSAHARQAALLLAEHERRSQHADCDTERVDLYRNHALHDVRLPLGVPLPR